MRQHTHLVVTAVWHKTCTVCFFITDAAAAVGPGQDGHHGSLTYTLHST